MLPNVELAVPTAEDLELVELAREKVPEPFGLDEQGREVLSYSAKQLCPLAVETGNAYCPGGK